MQKILFIGFRDKKTLIESALKKGYKFTLLIEKSEFQKEYENLFQNTIIVKNLFDWNEVKAVLLDANFDGVMTRYEDYTALVAAIADYLNLPSSGYKNALKSRNKFLMREAFREHDVPSADFALVQSLEDGREMIEKHGFPLILKQIAGIHSRYVFKVDSEADLKIKLDFLHTELAKDTSLLSQNIINYSQKINLPDPKKYFLLEEVLTGDELTVDAFISQGEIYLTPICRYVTSEEIGIPDHHLPIRIMPCEITKEDEELIYSVVKKALKSLKINYCATHTEVFFNTTTKECRLIEIASRGGGFRAEMYAESRGGDYDLAVVESALGNIPVLEDSKNKYVAVVEVFSPEDGILTDINHSFLAQNPKIKNITLNKKTGENVGLAKHGGKYIIKFLIIDDNYEVCLKQAEHYLFQIQNSIQVK